MVQFDSFVCIALFSKLTVGLAVYILKLFLVLQVSTQSVWTRIREMIQQGRFNGPQSSEE